MPLDFNSPVPLYHQLYLELKEGLETGRFEAGDKLPSEPDLSMGYGIGRPTVRQALDVLFREGWIEKRRGSGTFVKEKPLEPDLFSLGGTTAAFEREGIEIRRQIIGLPRVCAGEMGSEPPLTNPHFRFSRLFSDPDGPVLFERYFMDCDVFPSLDRFDLSEEGLSLLLSRVYRMRPVSGRQSFRAVLPEREVARALGLKAESPVLAVKRKLQFPGHHDAFLCELFCRTDRYHFSQELPGI